MNKDDIVFSPEELMTLRKHGIVLFADRVIFNAEPPMPATRIAAVEVLCAGPLPEALLALWSRTAGGRLDYDLSLPMNGNIEAVSWSELFWDGSSDYRDLQGWIEHEQELAEEAADADGSAWDGKLTHLPFGGFEYLDRIYAVVEAGTQHGSIVAWKHGLPPAWTHRLHQDAVSTVAPDLYGAFAALQLDQDPLAPVGNYFAGQSLLEYLDDRREAHQLDPHLADKLVAFYRRAVVDWRTPLARGALGRLPGVARVALHHAIATDDARLVAQLAAAGVDLQGPQQGSALPIDVAINQGAFDAAQALVRAGARVAHDALNQIDGPVPPELTTLLLAGGAQPSVSVIIKCAACGATDSAQLVAEACERSGIHLPSAFNRECDAVLRGLKSDADKVRTGKLGHYLGADGLAQRIERLESFRSRYPRRGWLGRLWRR